MAAEEEVSPEQLAAMRAEAARKRAENTKGAQKERAKNEELADATAKEESRSRMLQGRLNVPPAEGRESAEQKMARMPGTPNVREYLRPTFREDTGAPSGLYGQMQKQVGNARTRISKNINHGVYLDALSDELAGRIGIVASRNKDSLDVDDAPKGRNLRMSIPMFHVRQAQKHIMAHQEAHGRGDVDTAYDQLTQATDHLNEAANSAIAIRAGDYEKGIGLRATDSEADRSGFLTDDWKPFGVDKYEAGMSLEGFHRQLNDVRTAYETHYQETHGGIRPQVFDRLRRNYAPGVTTPKTSLTPETATAVLPGTKPKKARGVKGERASVSEDAMAKGRAKFPKEFHEMLGINEGNKIPLVEAPPTNAAYQQHIKALFEGSVKPLPTEGEGKTIDTTAAEEGLVNAVAEARANAEADEKNKRKKKKRQPMTYGDASAFAEKGVEGKPKSSLKYDVAPAKRTLEGTWIEDTSSKPVSNVDESAAGARERLGLGTGGEPTGTGGRSSRVFSDAHDGARA
jgi:hypothetical protein